MYNLTNKWSEVDGVTTALKEDAAAGKVLSENDYTDSDKARLADTSGSNTGDQDLSGKVDKVAGKELSDNNYTDAEKTNLSNQSGTNTGDQDLSGYQPIEAGKGLSENDYIDADKAAVTALDSMSTKGEWYGTQSEYDALGAWEAETYYFINDVV